MSEPDSEPKVRRTSDESESELQENAVGDDQKGEGIATTISKSGSKSFVCTYCKRDFRSEPQCKRHITSVHKKQPYSCKECKVEFRLQSEYRAHSKQHEKAQVEHMVDKDQPDRTNHQCQVCDADFKTLKSYKQHLNKHAGVKPNKDTLPCGMCDAVFKSREGRRVHMILKHSAGTTYKCEECPMIFARKGNLRLHMTTHGVRPHVCSVCGKSYARIDSLKTHEQACAEGNLGLKCESCGQRFRKQELLDKHLLLGHPDKEHQCNHCGQGFETKRALSHHVRVHEGTFRCSHCPLQFVTEKALENHQKGRHWEILGIERVVGNQGKRKDGPARSKEPKMRVRRNKHNPFLGMEHLVEQAKEDGEKTDNTNEIEDKIDGLTVKKSASPEYIVQEYHIDSETETLKIDVLAEEIEVKPPELPTNVHLFDIDFLDDESNEISNDQKPEMIAVQQFIDDVIENKMSRQDDNALEKHVGVVKSDGADDPVDRSEVDPKEEHDQSEASEHDYNDLAVHDTTDEDPDWTNEPDAKPDPVNVEVKCDQLVEGSASPKEKVKRKRRRKHDLEQGQKKPKAKNPYPKKWRCDTCEKSFAHQYWLVAHRRKAHGIEEKDAPPPKKPRIHFCDQCSKSFSDWRNLVYHLKHIHGVKIHEKDQVKCQSCKKKFLNDEDLKRHSCFRGNFLNREPIYKCKLCDKAYYSQHGLDSHKSAHREYHRFNCDACWKPFANEKDMNYHKKRVHVEATFACEVCGKSFKVLAQLRIHVQIHEKLKGYQCEYCGKSFSQRNGMTAHVKISHAEQLGEEALAEREITCEICQKKLKGKICYKLHMKTHTNERDFGCTYCEKRFISRQDKIRHEQTHTKEYRFKCRYCDKGSTRRKLILLHESREHNVTPAEAVGPSHKCKICGKCFSSPSALTIHESLHSDDLPVECELCDRRFKNIKYMKYHLKAHHDGKRHNLEEKKPEIESRQDQVQTSAEPNIAMVESGSLIVSEVYTLSEPTS